MKKMDFESFFLIGLIVIAIRVILKKENPDRMPASITLGVPR